MKSPVEIRRHFASDNYAGICPEAWSALADANQGHAVSYGDDPWTARAADLIREVFEMPCEVFFVFNGTAANSLALASTGQSYHSILCHQMAHVETDECGAPEFFSNGMKVVQSSTPKGSSAPSTGAATSISPNRARSASPNRPKPARSIRSTRSKPSGKR